MFDNMRNEHKSKKKGIFWIIIVLVILITNYFAWASGNRMGIKESLNEQIKEITLEHSNKCIEYFCENIFNSSFIEGNAENNFLGRCDGEEYKSVGALEECRMMLFGE